MPVIKKIFLLSGFIFTAAVSAFGKNFNAAYFGIKPDGKTLNTRSVQFAIDYISEKGGGCLLFEAGTYLSGSVYLKSNVTLNLEEGAVLKGSTNPFDYDRYQQGFSAFIFAIGQRNIGITGKGRIDGQGNKVALNVINNIEKGLINDAYTSGRASAEIRPMLIYFRNDDNVTVQNITFHNSACWTATYEQCRHLKIDRVKVDDVYYWNEDGMDIVDCSDATITNNFINASDDGICLKSQTATEACNNIYIYNNVIRSSANGIKFGTASYGGFQNIKIIKNTVYNTYRTALALEAVDGGYIRDVYVDTLIARNVGNLIFLRLGARSQGKTSNIDNVHISHVTGYISANKPDTGYEYEGPVEDLPRNISPAIIISGLPGAPVKNIFLSDISLDHPGGGDTFYANISLDHLNDIPELPAQYPEYSMFKELPSWGIFARHAAGLRFTNVSMKCRSEDFRVPIVLDDVAESSFLNITNTNGHKQVYQYKTKNITIK